MSNPNQATRDIENIRRWIEAKVGGTVREIVRQPRWRPSWFASVDGDGDGDGERLDLYIRGDRVDMPLIFPLEHEMQLQSLLFDHGIPVPRVYGWIDDPQSYAMEVVTGAVDFANTPDAERDAVVDDYLRILVAMHRLDVDTFACGGIMRASSPAQSGTLGIGRYEAVYRSVKRGPEPFLEFVLGWLQRHPTDTQGREAVVVWDSGQFMHEGGRVRAVLDVEIGHIGDPMMDLAGWRMRDTVMNYGDFNTLYRRYEELGGFPIDMDAIKKYHLAFTLSPRLPVVHSLREPPVDGDLMNTLQWCGETDLFAVEALADLMGIELPELEMPEPDPGRARPAFDLLVGKLRSVTVDDAELRYQLRMMFRLARHAQRVDEIGAAVDAADLDDLEGLLGHRPASWSEGERELEDFVLTDAASGAYDEALTVLFYKRNRRAQFLIGPAGSAMARHHKIQRFS